MRQMSLAAVLGSASGGMDELATLRRLTAVTAVFAVNDAAADYPGDLAAFVTLHPEKLATWLPKRRSPPAEVIAHESHPLATRVVEYQWPGMTGSGSSGLFAVKVALEQFDRVVLCGVPMDPFRAHYFDGAPWFEVDSFTAAWKYALPHLLGVRSMSGWTAGLLGTPDEEFLNPKRTHALSA